MRAYTRTRPHLKRILAGAAAPCARKTGRPRRRNPIMATRAQWLNSWVPRAITDARACDDDVARGSCGTGWVDLQSRLAAPTTTA